MIESLNGEMFIRKIYLETVFKISPNVNFGVIGMKECIKLAPGEEVRTQDYIASRDAQTLIITVVAPTDKIDYEENSDHVIKGVEELPKGVETKDIILMGRQITIDIKYREYLDTHTIKELLTGKYNPEDHKGLEFDVLSLTGGRLAIVHRYNTIGIDN